MTARISSLWESYKIILKIVGEKKKDLNRSFLGHILCSAFQGLAFSLIYPLLTSVFRPDFVLLDALIWLLLICVATVISLSFKWFALNFANSDGIVDVMHNLRLMLGTKIKTMPLQKLSQYRTGELNAVLAQNVDDSVLPMGVVAAIMFEAMVVAIVIIGATVIIEPRLALAMVIAIIAGYPLYIWSRKRNKAERDDNLTAHATLEADTVEYLQGIAVLRSNNQVGENSARLMASIARARNVQIKGMSGAAWPMAILNTLVEFVILMIVALGAWWIAAGTFSVAALVALLVVVHRINEPLINLLNIVRILDIMEVSFQRIEKLMNIDPLKVKAPQQLPKRFDITFEHVDFSYSGHDNKALSGVSFTIPSGKLTAIVGPSGSGKTTITRLIMRYDDPERGTIKIGGVDLRNMTQAQLMAHISMVFQDVYLFDDSILNNIKMGKPEASAKEVIEAAKKANCHDFISKLPYGYETRAGEIGGSLSGGEKQRISIARAILKDAPIVILDEPTSALDTESEVLVQAAIDKLIVQRTVIVIAHRLSTVVHAEKILVFDQGTLCESGEHRELLLQQKGKYAAMFKAQQRVKQWNLAHS